MVFYLYTFKRLSYAAGYSSEASPKQFGKWYTRWKVDHKPHRVSAELYCLMLQNRNFPFLVIFVLWKVMSSYSFASALNNQHLPVQSQQ